MTVLLYLGFAASIIGIVCSHNEHYGAAQGWGSIQMALLWVYFLLRGAPL